MSVNMSDLYGNVPDHANGALVLIDVINDLDFPQGQKLLTSALPMAKRLLTLKQRVKRAGIPVVYVNDNFGKWRSDFRRQVAHCLEDGTNGEPLVRLLAPNEDDYFVLKPKHSGFFSTTLETLLRYLGSRRLILTGIAGNFCVLFTANDAYMRDYELIIPSDCTASNSAEENREALALMRKFLKADTRPSTRVRLPGPPKKKRQR